MKNEIVKNLCSLIQLDIDAIHAYEQALDNIENTTISEKLTGFKEDHIEHVKTLSEIVKKLGEEPPENNLDIKGFFISGFTAIRSLTGTGGALKAMVSNEELTTKTYEEALNWDVPDDVKEIIEKNYEDEKRHLKYIQEALEEKVWER